MAFSHGFVAGKVYIMVKYQTPRKAPWHHGGHRANLKAAAARKPTRRETRLATFSKETGRFAGLFALFGSFPALFGLGLVFFCVALDRWLSKTGRDDHVVPTIILIIGFAVGYWWQGRVAEGAGLFALQFGVLLVLDRLRI